MNIDRLKEHAIAEIEAAEERLCEVSRAIQAQPEIGYHEFEAAALLIDGLETHGFEVQRGLAGLPTSFRATLRGRDPGPTVALLAEYDALPEVGHGCGHNLIGAGALGAAIGLKAVMAELPGRLLAIGTPAEEFTGRLHIPGTPDHQRATGGGKIQMLEAGVFDDVDVCLMFHPSTENKVIRSNLAFAVLELEFEGRPAHAAADPWNGVNALDGILLTYMGINALRQHIQTDTRIHGIITHGGDAANIIPERATASFMVRAPNRAGVEALVERVVHCAEGAALATGARLIDRHLITVDNVRINPTLQGTVIDNFVTLGAEPPPPIRGYGSTDFGNVSQYRPGSHFYVGTHPADMAWHSEAVAEGSVSDEAHAGMLLGSKVLAMTAIDLLSTPGLVDDIRRDFESGG